MPYVSHEKRIEDQKINYYRALRESQKTFKTTDENITPWLEFFLPIILAQAQEAIGLINHETIERLLSPKQLAIWQYLQEHKQATRRDIAAHTGIAEATINQALKKLLSLKRIERIGEGAGTRYKIA